MFTEDECQGHATVSNGRNADTDKYDFSETDSTTMDIDDDFILDVSDSDIVDPEVGGHYGDSTHAPSAPSAPSVPKPVATTSVLAKMATTEYSLIQESVVRPHAPLLNLT